MATRADVYNAINGERNYQDAKWGGPEQDKLRSVGDFLIYMSQYIVRAKRTYTEGNEKAALEEIRKVTALGVVCMEVHGAPER